jgi:hypothetical protein
MLKLLIMSSIIIIKSLIDIIEIIEKSGIEPKDIIVGFDFDGTLNLPTIDATRPILKRAALRDGALELLDYLKLKEMRSVIITAAYGAVDQIPITLGQMGIVFESSIFYNSFPNNSKTKFGLKYEQTRFKFGDVDMNIRQCYGIVSAESMYDKQISMEYILQRYNLNPKLIIYIDDGVVNVVTMYHHFTHKDVPICVAYFPHSKSHEEPNHEECLKEILHIQNEST